ncbi:MAG: hypothetical protein AB8V79_05130 [Candidatus Midichloria sp.]|uniref:Uncharacterized protein n=1 Tax=Hyalomma marginatum TaxID=34627 RepID=A0A8S4C2Z8_9ACAR|nr:hypothetical protein MHYMCMPASI_00791 [Hyalomma marginatum]CAG7594931.1 hypothetical protein MHYMCMPSP_00919 [Hyalomma marginatum]
MVNAMVKSGEIPVEKAPTLNEMKSHIKQGSSFVRKLEEENSSKSRSRG